MTTNNSVNNEFLNDVLVTTSVAGDTSHVDITNSDNTNAASHARLSITTGGAGGGDPYIHFTNNVTDWTMGIDNSDSDAFVVSNSATLGTTNTARCSVDGEWNYPLQSAFHAYKDANALNVTGAGALYTPIHNVSLFDQGGDYSTATGIYTAPTDGKYLLIGTCYLSGQTAQDIMQTRVVTSNLTYYIFVRRPNANTGLSAGSSVIADMDLGDTAYIVIMGDGEAGNIDDYIGQQIRNQFSGTLLQ